MVHSPSRRSRRSASWLLVLCSSLAALPGCSRAAPEPTAQVGAAPPAAGGQAQGAVQPLRQVMRTAELALEVRSAATAHSRAVTIVEGRGGYVAGSESRSAGDRAQSSLSARVPEQHLSQVLRELRGLASGDVSERTGSQDVSDEVVDVDARIRNSRGLEEQLLGLLKTANSVESALKVHHELAAVRGEVERLTGRRLFLERETTWATVQLTLSEPSAPVAALIVLRSSLSEAKSDALAIATGMVAGGIRLAGALLPLVLLVLAPLAGLFALMRALVGRRRARRLASAAQ